MATDKPKKKKEISETVQKNLQTIIKHFETEEYPVRERQLRLWKKLNYYWSGFTRIWWSEVNHDWRIFGSDVAMTENDTSEAAYYDKPVNVFRAYLESLIAAMSVVVPALICVPDDADNQSDVTTAKGGDKICDLVYKHNDAPLLWCKALFVYCTQGMIAAYNYTKEDPKFGLVDAAEYEDVEQEMQSHFCPECGAQLSGLDFQKAMDLLIEEGDEFQPDDEDAKLHSMIMDGKVVCPECAQEVDPELKNEKVIVTRLAGMTSKPKARQIIEVNGGLFVGVANYARCQEDTPYLKYCYETHFTNVYKKYPDLRKKVGNIKPPARTTQSGYDQYERWARLSPQYYGEYPINTPTVRNWWLRPQSFEIIDDETEREELYKLFPDGCKTVFINESFAEACNESLDDSWTLTYNPLSEYIHYDPLGLLLTSVQEITSDLISLVLQTIEHGISQTFADPTVLNFNQYRQTEAMVGQIFPAKAKSGKTLQDAFFELKTATLSAEVEPFSNKIQELGQFVSGALPSLFGGMETSGSKTAAQYSMSRAQALQRLQTPWKMLTYWWKNIFSKVIPAYIKNMIDDEKYVVRKNGNFINVLVRKAEMDGKIGDVELEASELLPSTWGTQKDLIMNLLALNNPQILATLADPKNLPLIAEAFGMYEFYIPGEDDREKQNEEIQLLVQSGPIPGPNGMESSIQPETEVDNHIIHASVCKSWCVSEEGRLAKTDNQQGYQNVLLHLQAHLAMLTPQPTTDQAQNQSQRPANQPKPKGQQLTQTQGATNAGNATATVQ
jgi:hypothetical protein